MIHMRMDRRWLILAAVFSAFVLFFILSGPEVSVQVSKIESTSPSDSASFSKENEQEHQTNIDPIQDESESHIFNPEDEESFVQFMVSELIKNHGTDIHDINVQMMLLDLKRMICESHGEEGNALFKRILTLAFPEHADDILKLIASLETYEEWYQSNLSELSQLSEVNREAILSEKRRELLGDKAEELWPSDSPSQQQETQRQQLQITLTALNQDDQNTLDEKLYLLTSALSDQSDGSSISDLSNQATVANLFFGLDSVQNDLKNLSDQERQSAINEQRRAMGYSDQEIERLAKEDAAKEERWQNGYTYMEQRRTAEEQLQGADLDNKLASLRQTFFESEAKTIAAEEASGFFRYERPRYYGRN